MRLPRSLEFLRHTAAWQHVRDWRYLRSRRPRRDFYRQLFPARALVFDIGANVGHYTLVLASAGARVLAVEPQAALVAELRRRFARRPRVTILHSALGPAASTATLHKAPGLSEIASLRADIAERSRFSGEHAFSETETVPVTTLDALIAQHGVPAFCKIDVEGYELSVLAGLTRPLPLLCLEFNREFGRETDQCLARLAELGEYLFNFTPADVPAFTSSTWLSAGELRTLLAGNPDPLLWGDIYARLP